MTHIGWVQTPKLFNWPCTLGNLAYPQFPQLQNETNPSVSVRIKRLRIGFHLYCYR